MTQTVEETRYVTSTDKPESAHFVMVPPGQPDESPQAYVLRARIEGFAITALCGFVWVPKQDPANLPICQECLDIYESEDRSDDSGEGLPDA